MKGAPEMVATLRRMQREYPKLVGRGMFIEGNVEMTESKKRCPVDTRDNAPHPGLLRSTGHVSEPEYRGKDITVVLSYNTDYAVHVHENPDAFHPVGQWKYLESVLNESRSFMAARIARHIHLDRVRI